MSSGDVKKKVCASLTVSYQRVPLSYFLRELPPLSNSHRSEETLRDFFGLEFPEPATCPGPKTALTNVCSALWVLQKAPSSRHTVLTVFTFLTLAL